MCGNVTRAPAAGSWPGCELAEIDGDLAGRTRQRAGTDYELRIDHERLIHDRDLNRSKSERVVTGGNEADNDTLCLLREDVAGGRFTKPRGGASALSQGRGADAARERRDGGDRSVRARPPSHAAIPLARASGTRVPFESAARRRSLRNLLDGLAQASMGRAERGEDGADRDIDDGRDLLVVEVGVVAEVDGQPLSLR